MTYLFAVFLIALFWAGYALGWRDAKQETHTIALMDRLFEMAKRGLKAEPPK